MSCKSVCVPVPAHVISDWRQQGMLCLTGESLCPRLLQMGWKMIKISMMPGPISQFLMEPGGTNYSAAGLGKKIPPPWNITAQLSAFMAAQNFSWYQLFSFGKDKVLESTALFCCCNFLKKFPLLPERIASHEYACICRLWASQESRVASPGILPAGCPRSCQCLPVQPPSGSQHKLVACLLELIWKNTPKHSALPKKTILTQLQMSSYPPPQNSQREKWIKRNKMQADLASGEQESELSWLIAGISLSLLKLCCLCGTW